ncbi:MAG: hypothetical protein P8X74_03695 [Reinekea sp.]
MKFFILIPFIFLVLACSSGPSGSSDQPSEDQQHPATDPTSDATSDETPTVSGIKMSLVSKSGDLYFFKDDNLTFQTAADHTVKADTATYAIDDHLITFDATGDVSDDIELPTTPKYIKTVMAHEYYCVEYSAEISYALGGTAKIHTEIYQDMAVVSEWYNNEWECTGIKSAGINAFFLDQNDAKHRVSGTLNNVVHIENDKFVMSDLDTTMKKISFNGVPEDYVTNNILAARQWIEEEDVYYSENGYTWSETGGLTENATAMQGMQAYPWISPLDEQMPYGQHPVFLKVGKYHDALYWIECNTGWLFEYDISGDSVDNKWRLYEGDGLHSTGIFNRDNLSPTLTDGVIYYTYDETVMEIDIEAGLTGIFFSGPGQTMEF